MRVQPEFGRAARQQSAINWPLVGWRAVHAMKVLHGADGLMKKADNGETCYEEGMRELSKQTPADGRKTHDHDDAVAIYARAGVCAMRLIDAHGLEKKEVFSRRVELASPLLWLVLGMALLGGCDPRLPYVRPKEAVVNFPPTIDLDSVSPPPNTLPVDVLIGEGCLGANTFRVDNIDDADLAVDGEIKWRWRIAARDDNGEAATRIVDGNVVVNPNDDVGTAEISLGIIPFEITNEGLRGTFFGLVDRMVGQTHRLDVIITDGDFSESPNSVEVTPLDAGRAYFYWLFTLDDQPCQ